MKWVDFFSKLSVCFFIMVWGLISCDISLANEFYGAASIDSQTGLASTDFAFHIETDASGAMILGRSYIIPEKTTLFKGTGVQVDGNEAGPMVESGYLQVPNFELVTEPFTEIVNGRNTTRQITLSGTTQSARGDVISGDYTEVIAGYLDVPITLTGTFLLTRATDPDGNEYLCQDVDNLAPFGELTADEIRAGGNDALKMEFRDLGCAMSNHLNPGAGLQVGEYSIEEAIADFRTNLHDSP